MTENMTTSTSSGRAVSASSRARTSSTPRFGTMLAGARHPMVSSVKRLWLAWVSINDDAVLGSHDGWIRSSGSSYIDWSVRLQERSHPKLLRHRRGFLSACKQPSLPESCCARRACARGMQCEERGACKCLPTKATNILIRCSVRAQ